LQVLEISGITRSADRLQRKPPKAQPGTRSTFEVHSV
jgi:hypothetical protein